MYRIVVCIIPIVVSVAYLCHSRSIYPSLWIHKEIVFPIDGLWQ